MVDLKKITELAIKIEEEDILAGQMRQKFIGMKDNVPRLMLYPGENIRTHRDKVAWGMDVLCSTVDFDHFIQVADTYGASKATKFNGEPWQAGELQQAVEENWPEKIMVYEVLVVSIVDRKGRVTAANVRYERDDDRIVFDINDDTFMREDKNQKIGGFYPDAMRHAMTSPLAIDALANHPEMQSLGMTRTEIQAIISIEATRKVASEGMMVAISPMNAVEMEKMTRLLADEEMVQVFDVSMHN